MWLNEEGIDCMTAIVFDYEGCQYNEYGYYMNEHLNVDCPHPSAWVKHNMKWMHADALDWYYEDTTHEYEYDDGTYHDLEELMSEIYEGCDDFENRGDKYGDGCDWYNENWEMCGSYDTDTFIAAKHCCACEGGQRVTGCTDIEVASDDQEEWNRHNTDELGYTCANYE